MTGCTSKAEYGSWRNRGKCVWRCSTRWDFKSRFHRQL